jgi:hypothetical protein
MIDIVLEVCGRCNRALTEAEEEICIGCEGPLCVMCWDEFGEDVGRTQADPRSTWADRFPADRSSVQLTGDELAQATDGIGSCSGSIRFGYESPLGSKRLALRVRAHA